MLLLWNISSSAQTFSDVSASTGFSVLSQSTSWGNGVSFFDVDEDGWDDLTVCVAGAPTRFYHNNQGTFSMHTAFFNDLETKACLWLDLDEDGDNDLFVSRYNAPHQIFLNQGDMNFVDVSGSYDNLSQASDLSWGAAFGDYNRDAFLDLCIANYGVEGAVNKIANNLGDGTFQISNFSALNAASRTSFQPVWMDLNRDLYQDLYIINDHNQGNEYYVQSAPGVFEDKTSQCGLTAQASAMSNSWCDFDRDGDFDVYITNTIQGNRLMVNNGQDLFSDNAILEGVSLNAWTWSSLWLDVENDGWEDLFVASEDLVNNLTSNHYLFKNTQGDFVPVFNSGLDALYYGGYASAKGDFNNDGKVDVALLTEQNVKYKLFQNNSSVNNNYFKFRLRGRLSNRNGIGTRYEYWVGGEKRIGYTYCGDGYLTQNSQNNILGLGTAGAIDSLKLFWISGVVDTYFDLSANDFKILVEGETTPGIVASKYEICPGQDSVLLTLNGWPHVIWENGSTEDYRYIYSAGNYTASVSTGFGHSLELSIAITETAFPQITATLDNPSCFQSSNGNIQVLWQDGSFANEINLSNLSAGSYTLPIEYGQACVQELVFELTEPAALEVQVQSDSANCANTPTASIQLQVSGGTIPYDFGTSNGSIQTNLSAGLYSGTITDNNGCEVSWSTEIFEPLPLFVEAVTNMPSAFNEGSVVLSVSGGTGDYSYNWSNGNQSAENLNLNPGDYSVTITDGNGCEVDTSFSLLFNYVNSLNLNTMNWTLHKDGLHYEGSETLHHVFVYDAVGRLLHREQILSGHTCIPMQSAGPVFILSHEGNWKSSIYTE